jgi:hypothetical protein
MYGLDETVHSDYLCAIESLPADIRIKVLEVAAQIGGLTDDHLRYGTACIQTHNKLSM